MRESLHIFRKDARHFAIHIALFIALVFASGAALIGASRAKVQSPSSAAVEQIGGLMLIAVPVYAWFLIAMAIHDEPLPGDTQFWTTRPYRRSSLVLAKVLFVLAFVNLPLLVSDIALISFHRLWGPSLIPDLLLKQVVVSLWLILPAFAIAAVTRGLAQFVLFLVLCAIGVVLVAMIPPSFMHTGIGVSAISWRWIIPFASALLVLAALIAYTKRRIFVSRVIVALAFLSIDVPPLWATVNVLLSSHSPVNTDMLLTGHPIAMSIDVTDVTLETNSELNPDFASIRVPVHLTSLPSGTTRLSVGGRATLDAQGEKSIKSQVISRSNVGELGRNPFDIPAPADLGDQSLWIQLLRADYAHLAGKTADLHLSIQAIAYRDAPFTRIPIGTKHFVLAGIGRCEPSPDHLFVCSTALRPPKPFVAYLASRNGQESGIFQDHAFASDSVFPVLSGLDPIDTWRLPWNASAPDATRELVFSNPGKPIQLIASASAEIRIPEPPKTQ